MQITEVENKGLKRVFQILIPGSEINNNIEKELKDLQGKVKVDGFRKGKVPVNIIKKMYGESVKADVINDTISEKTSSFLKEREIRTVRLPDIKLDEIADDKLQFTISFEMFPAINQPNLENITLKSYDVKFSDEDINNALDGISKNFATLEQAPDEYQAQTGDSVEMDFKGFIEGVAFEGGEAKHHQLELGSGSFIPGFEEQLVGSKAGDKKDVLVQFPEAYHSKDLAGKDAKFEVEVHKILKKIKQEINDEFVKKHGFENIDALKEQIVKGMKESYANANFVKMKKELFDQLEKVLDMQMPEELLENEFNNLFESVKEAMQKDPENPEFKGKSEEQVREEYKKTAARRVKIGLFLSEYSQHNDCEPTGAEVSEEIYRYAGQFKGMENKMLEYVRKNKAIVENIKGSLLEDKAVKSILEKVKKEAVELSKEDFAKTMDEV